MRLKLHNLPEENHAHNLWELDHHCNSSSLVCKLSTDKFFTVKFPSV